MNFVLATQNVATLLVTTPTGSVLVQQPASPTVINATQTGSIVTAITSGPQGAPGGGLTVNTSAKVDKSVVYYDSASGEFKADAIWTIPTIVKGGSF